MKKLLTLLLLLVVTGARADTLPLLNPFFFVSGFSPTNVANLILWLDANDNTTLYQDSGLTTPVAADGDPVGGWVDKSASGNNATQSTGAARPTYKTGIQNGQPVLRLDGTEDYLVLAFNFNPGTAELFIVVKANNDPATGGPGSLNGLYWLGFTTQDTHFPYSDGNIYDGFYTDARKVVGNPATTLAQWNVYDVMSASGEFTARLNNAQIFTTASNTPGSQSGSKNIGKAFNSVFFPGDIAEILIYGANLSSGDRTSVYDYLKAKWALP